MFLTIALTFCLLNLIIGIGLVFGDLSDETIIDGVVIDVNKKGSTVRIEYADDFKDVHIPEKYPIDTELSISYNYEFDSAGLYRGLNFKCVGLVLLGDAAMNGFYFLLGNWGEIEVNIFTFLLLSASCFLVFFAASLYHFSLEFADKNVKKIEVIHMYSNTLEDDESYESPVYRYFENGEEKFIDHLEYSHSSETELQLKSSTVRYNEKNNSLMSEALWSGFRIISEVAVSIALVLFTCILFF